MSMVPKPTESVVSILQMSTVELASRCLPCSFLLLAMTFNLVTAGQCTSRTYLTTEYLQCGTTKTMAAAASDCVSQGYILVRMETDSEYQAVQGWMTSSTWVGARWSSTYNSYVWDSTSTAVAENHFANGDSSHTLDCVSYDPGSGLIVITFKPKGLRGSNCDDLKSYICEEIPETTTISTTTPRETTDPSTAALHSIISTVTPDAGTTLSTKITIIITPDTESPTNNATTSTDTTTTATTFPDTTTFVIDTTSANDTTADSETSTTDTAATDTTSTATTFPDTTTFVIDTTSANDTTADSETSTTDTAATDTTSTATTFPDTTTFVIDTTSANDTTADSETSTTDTAATDTTTRTTTNTTAATTALTAVHTIDVTLSTTDAATTTTDPTEATTDAIAATRSTTVLTVSTTGAENVSLDISSTSTTTIELSIRVLLSGRLTTPTTDQANSSAAVTTSGVSDTSTSFAAMVGEITGTSTATTVAIATNTPMTTVQTGTTTVLANQASTLVDSTASLPQQPSSPRSAFSYSSLANSSTSQLCSCRCPLVLPTDKVQREEFVNDQVKKIKSELEVEKQTLSASVRQKTSAGDLRPSATYLGYFGISLLCVACSSVLVLDLTFCARAMDSSKAKDRLKAKKQSQVRK